MKIERLAAISIICTLLFMNLIFALEYPPEQIPANKINEDRINIESDMGILESITYTISSTRLNNKSTTTYQTSEIYVDIGDYTFTVSSSELATIKPSPDEGTVYHMITITTKDITKDLKDWGASEAEIKDIEEKYFKNPEKIEVRAKIDIMQNGEPVASIDRKEDIEDIAGEYGFIDKHFEDMHTRFKPAYIPIIPKEEEKAPKTGLRPTIIIDDSEEDY